MTMATSTFGIINCTPHDVCVYDGKGVKVKATFSRSAYAPRLSQEPQREVGSLTTASGEIIPVYSPQKFGEVEGLPPYDEGNCPDIIVSMLVGKKLQEIGTWPGGVYGPDTGQNVVRGADGEIMGTKCLIEYCARKET